MNEVRLRYNNPRMAPRISSGKFPKNLTFGFEAELESKFDWQIGWNDREYCTKKEQNAYKTLFGLIHSNYGGFCFIKEEHSLDNGIEVTTHPFNWNWLQKHADTLDWFGKLRKNGFTGKSSCGFHVHIGRNYFTQDHLTKMIKFYYFNKKFIRKISKRISGMEYCDPDPYLFYDNDDYFGTGMKSTCFNIANMFRYKWSMVDKSCALNLYPKNTIEVRIFQGTSNKRLIKAYLEFVRASVMFTKGNTFEEVTVKNFRKYLYARESEYPFAAKLVRNPKYFNYR